MSNDVATEWATFIEAALAQPSGQVRSAALAQVCLAADPMMAESGAPGRPSGRPLVDETRVAARALAEAVAVPANRIQRYQ